MKKLFIFFILLVISISCNDQSSNKNIEVGMTYEEVEQILGKPKNISRGASELVTNFEDMTNELFYSINTDTTIVHPRFTRWITPKEIKTVGNFIYVAWIYNDTKTDTFFVVINNRKIIYDTTFSKTKKYYVGNLEVSERKYHKHTGMLYLSPQGRMIPKKDYDFFKSMNTNGLKPPQDGNKRIETSKTPHIKSKYIDDGTSFNYYQVISNKQIIFDASSGRVTNTNYFPISLDQVQVYE